MEALPAFALYAFVTAITPGPNNIMLTTSGANFGFRRTVPHIAGIQIGFAVMMLAIGFGLGSIFIAEPRLQTALKVVGITYLLWLAWKIAISRASSDERDADSRPMTFLQAALFQWVNAKAWIMTIGAFAVYGGSGGDIRLILALTIVYAIVGTPTSLFWAGFGVGVRTLLADPRYLRAFNIAMAALLVASIIPMVV